MDPKACLDAVERNLWNGQLPDALEGLENYAEWRRKGGCEPAEKLSGDVQAKILRDALMGAIRKSLKLPRKKRG